MSKGLQMIEEIYNVSKEKKLGYGIALSEFVLGNVYYQIAEIYSYRDESDKAFEWLDRAYNQRDGGLSSIKGDPTFKNIRNDPRFNEFLKKMKLPL